MDELFRIQLQSHYYCLAGYPNLIAGFQAMDLMFWISYSVISATMIWVLRGSHIQWNIVFMLYWMFIFFCGMTHLFDYLHYNRYGPEIDTYIYYMDAWLARGPGAIISFFAMVMLLTLRRIIRSTLLAAFPSPR